MDRDLAFEEKATLALSIGEALLGVENGHLTRIDPESDYWKAIASTDSADGRFPIGLQLDLRTPLNVAQGRVDLERSARDSDHLEIAARSLDRMEDLIADVLTMARQGHEIEETELVSLDATAAECWDGVRTESATLTVAEDLRFKADPGRARHLFENLFRNSIEHGGSDDGGSDVSVRVGPLDDGNGFYVEDDGPGIPAADRDRVFETGFTTGTERLGLGLAIVEGVVDAHGWAIATGESAEGGVRFEVSGVVVP
ncbi:HAMP domain-containing sensor histidine kinase [Halorubrum sp. CSM-61]|uniref:sensor histidine kinase n=1 Tax=Halorubrum sp. CSM-61 TaxID=2485838 RepID=UPI0024052897|nr:HAMP domain-containing sensor histidine kinase [Halorubrum sp. CSM-61]